MAFKDAIIFAIIGYIGKNLKSSILKAKLTTFLLNQASLIFVILIWLMQLWTCIYVFSFKNILSVSEWPDDKDESVITEPCFLFFATNWDFSSAYGTHPPICSLVPKM